MRDWSKTTKRWRCDTCLLILSHHEIWQVQGSSAILCQTCFGEFLPIGARFNETPILCDECGKGMLPLERLLVGGFGDDGQYCRRCTTELSEIDVDGAISGLLSILEDTHEKG